MSIDTSALTTAVQQILQNVFDYLPIGVVIFGTVGALVGGLMFGQKLVNVVVSALSRFGGSGR